MMGSRRLRWVKHESESRRIKVETNDKVKENLDTWRDMDKQTASYYAQIPRFIDEVISDPLRLSLRLVNYPRQKSYRTSAVKAHWSPSRWK